MEQPHVVFLPHASHGHIKPMLKLAELLSHGGFQVTFFNNRKTHDHLLHSMDMAAFRRCHPDFEFLSLPSPTGQPAIFPSTYVPTSAFVRVHEKILSTTAMFKPALAELLTFISDQKKGGLRKPVTCIIADGLLFTSVLIDVAEQFQIPLLALRTSSACCMWTYFHLQKLVEEGHVPFQEENMDKLITCIPGLENVIRCRDLPRMFRAKKPDYPTMESSLNDQTLHLTRASALILNTFDELEAPMITKLSSHFSKIYTVGPLHALSAVRINDPTTVLASSRSSLWQEDRSCMNWIDSQLPKSVVFVSFGSVISFTSDQMLEFWHGLVNSGKPFLWVIRAESIVGEDNPSLILEKLKDMTEDNKGLMVSWVPQEQVLAHRAVAVFLTHSGWNSTLESVYAGVPMICWPAIGDQQINSRFVSDVWKIGFDMKDSCDRLIIEKMVRDLMEGKREEMMKSVNEIKKLARETVEDGGASFCNLEKLIDDIRLMSHLAQNKSEGKK